MTTSCAPATPSPTIGYLFGTTRSVQPRVSGAPGAEPRDLGRSLVLVAEAERTGGDARGQRLALHAERVGPEGPRRGEDDAIARQLVDEEFLHRRVRVGVPRRVAWTSWPCVW